MRRESSERVLRSLSEAICLAISISDANLGGLAKIKFNISLVLSGKQCESVGMKELKSPTAAAREITGSRKKRFFVHLTSNESTQNTASYWDSGSRNQYFAYNIKTGERGMCPTGVYPRFEANYTLKANEILVQVGTFMGKPATPSLTVQENDREQFEALFGSISDSNF